MAKLFSLLCVAGAVLVSLAPSCHSQTNDCRDRHQSCRTWAERGECYKNVGYMMVHCADSCHQCVVQDDNCKDTHDQCAAWANNGECQQNYAYMRKACARSCTFCMPANDHSVPYVHANLVDSRWEQYNKRFPGLARNHHV
ncbi:zinc metalloproteinase nas-13-like [Macrobrachium rosenbergii]|uniref:zinc metalloproteinase nas-13-like n=1 Tax=Macrobrachium rosenbergii TaxID=79674 RepID=UPI0034D5806D